MEDNNKWILVSLTGGFLMILSGTIGNLILYYILFEISQEYINNENLKLSLIALLIIVGIIADSGGIAVIIGTLLISVKHYRFGKAISSLGTGLGLVGFIFTLIYYYFLGFVLFGYTMSIITITSINGIIGASGLILTIFSRKKISKPKENELNEE